MPAANALLSSFCIVADDLSGAADCAAAFAPVAGPVPVLLGGTTADGTCIAIDTDSRALTEADAVAAVRELFARLASAGRHELVYKKIDSTLRGHIGAELAAAVHATPGLRAAVIAPAFPAQGRALRGGKLLVHGAAPAHLGHSGDLVAMLAAAGLRPIGLAPPFGDAAALARRIEASLDSGARAIALDAASDDELATIAGALRRIDSRVLVAGSAGLAHALAVHVSRGACGLAPAGGRTAGPVLTVVGSFSPAAAAQQRAVEASGVAHTIRLTPLQWLDERHADLRRSVAEDARLRLAQGRHVVLSIDAEDAVTASSRALVRAIAPLAAGLLGQVRACVLTGGDTARAVLDAAGVARLDVIGELEPGISIARAPGRTGCGFILKAGGFGDANALVRVLRRFGPATT